MDIILWRFKEKFNTLYKNAGYSGFTRKILKIGTSEISNNRPGIYIEEYAIKKDGTLHDIGNYNYIFLDNFHKFKYYHSYFDGSHTTIRFLWFCLTFSTQCKYDCCLGNKPMPFWRKLLYKL